MTDRIRNSLAILALLALVACAGSPESSARLASVWTEPGSGYVTVRWELAGQADRFEVSRARVGDGGQRASPFEPIASIEEGSIRSFVDFRVDPSMTYMYAVAVDGGVPVPDGSEGVRPAPGNPLRVLFSGPVPNGVVVRSEPAGIDCATDRVAGCTVSFAAILEVTLSLEAPTDVTVAWDGCDVSEGDACTVSMEEPRTVTATVEPARRTLEVEVEAPGAGRVTSVNDLGSDPAVDCSDACTYVYTDGLMIGLRADPIAPDDHRFVSWGGACAGVASPSCTVTMDEAKSVRADFEVIPPHIDSFEAAPVWIWSWETSTLSWSVSGGGEVHVSIEPEVGDVTGSSEVVVDPDETTTYTLTATNDGGTVTATTRVQVRSWPFGSLDHSAEEP